MNEIFLYRRQGRFRELFVQISGMDITKYFIKESETIGPLGPKVIFSLSNELTS